MASGASRERILEAYPQLEPADIEAALAYAARNAFSAQEPSGRTGARPDIGTNRDPC